MSGEIVVCGKTFHACMCTEEVGHEPPHACSRPSATRRDGVCRGQWLDDGTVIRYPTGAFTELEALEHARLYRSGTLID